MRSNHAKTRRKKSRDITQPDVAFLERLRELAKWVAATRRAAVLVDIQPLD
jgi:hypothetical protein